MAKPSWASRTEAVAYRGRRAWLGLGLSALLLTYPAAAQPGTAIDRDAARTLVQQGDERMDEGDLEGALEAYRRADDIMGVPTTSIEVGKVLLKLGRLVEARRALGRAARYPQKDEEPEPFTRARDEADRVLSELEPRIPTVEIAVTGPEASELELRIDGDVVEAWGRPLALDPGPHELTVAAEGYEDHGQVLSLSEGDRREVTVRMTPTPASTPPPERDEGFDWWPVAATGLSVAGTAAVVGAITGALSLDDASAAEELCDDSGACSPRAADPLARSRTLAHVSTASFAIAGAGAAMGVVGIVLALDDAEEDETQVGLGPGGFVIRGAF